MSGRAPRPQRVCKPLPAAASRCCCALTCKPVTAWAARQRNATRKQPIFTAFYCGKWAGRKSNPEIIQKLRCRCDSSHQQMVPRPRAGDVEQVAFGVVNLLQVSIVTDGFDALLQGDVGDAEVHHCGFLW